MRKHSFISLFYVCSHSVYFLPFSSGGDVCVMDGPRAWVSKVGSRRGRLEIPICDRTPSVGLGWNLERCPLPPLTHVLNHVARRKQGSYKEINQCLKSFPTVHTVPKRIPHVLQNYPCSIKIDAACGRTPCGFQF